MVGLKSLLVIIPLLVTAAFITLAERKFIASIQTRLGPNIMGFFGTLQPFVDGAKLMLKETIIPKAVNFPVFILAPLITFTLALSSWSVIPFNSGLVIADIDLGLLFLFAVSGLGVYGIILAGWASNSRFAFMGSIRSAAQMISYEVSFGLIMISLLLNTGSLNLSSIVLAQENVWLLFPLFPLAIIFYICALAETNRSPFDLVESESELIAGPFIEYSSVSLFGQFFLAEMSSILLYSTLYVLFFLGGWHSFSWHRFKYSDFFFAFKIIVPFCGFLVARATLPRFRYDQLNRLGWRIFLPLSLGFVPLFAGFELAFDILPKSDSSVGRLPVAPRATPYIRGIIYLLVLPRFVPLSSLPYIIARIERIPTSSISLQAYTEATAILAEAPRYKNGGFRAKRLLINKLRVVFAKYRI